MKPALKTIRRITGSVLFVYIAVVAMIYVEQRHMVFVPDHGHALPKDNNVGDMDIIHVRTMDGLTLEGWYKAPARADRPVVVFFQGNGGNMRGRGFEARAFLDAGYGFLFAEYRGYGGNPGNPTEQGLYSDGRAYIDWLIHEAGIPQERIVLEGQSLGTGVAVRMAMDYPRAAAIVLQSPYTDLVSVGAARYWWMPVRWLMHDRFDSLSLIPRLTIPLLVLHGKQDAIVPFSLGKALYDAAPPPKELAVYPDGTHVNLFAQGGQGRTLEYLGKLGKPQPQAR